ncbi:high mobility group B protein 2 [Humulus lupulus]|uniref:high mobility group B protein 2 n=1 Tax=Humulus lupulus TaxID=3486 RepID=UPI002B404981|nr:high mobility group B protein 2 [Humulus lupulus]
MAAAPRIRKRVRAIPRASDGSAFQNCHVCGVSVAIALADMHDCQSSHKVKRFKGIRASPKVKEESFWDQPRSAFSFFMEEFKENYESEEDSIEIDRKGFETWKNMSKKERQPYVREACYVDFVHEKATRKEACKMSKGHTFKECSEDSDDSDGWHTYASEDGTDPAAAESSEPDCWEDCTGYGWHTYVPTKE